MKKKKPDNMVCLLALFAVALLIMMIIMKTKPAAHAEAALNHREAIYALMDQTGAAYKTLLS